MTIYRLAEEGFVELSETTFDHEGLFERRELQRFLKANISILSNDMMVIAEEFADWQDSSRRIDLLCLDRDANLVVIEIKRTMDGNYMDLQAIRYAAMISAMTLDQTVTAHSRYLGMVGEPDDQARRAIFDFLDIDGEQDSFAANVRIILASADFSKELTTSVLWLNKQGLDIRCVRLKPYREAGGHVFLDVQQIIPLPEAADYQTQIKAKEQAERAVKSERHELRYQFWQTLLDYAKTKSDLHANRKAGTDNWISGGIGRAGFALTYVTLKYEGRVELFIDLGPGRDSKAVFRQLEEDRAKIDSEFGAPLFWDELPGARGCRIYHATDGGYRSTRDSWPAIHEKMVASMMSLHRVFRERVQRLGR